MNSATPKITKSMVMDFLKSENLGTLCTVNEANKPDGATIHYYMKDNFDIFFLTRRNTGKYNNIMKQNEVVLVVTNSIKMETVKIRGIAELQQEDAKIISEIITGLSESLGKNKDLDMILPIIKRTEGKIVPIKITPTEIRISRYKADSLEEEILHLKDF